MSSIDTTQFNQFGPNAKAWTFILSRALTEDEISMFTSDIDNFLRSWAAHKQPLPGSSLLIYSQILLVVAESFASGCSIDSLFTEVERIAATHGASLAPMGTIVTLQTNGKPKLSTRSEFRLAYQEGSVKADTPVFNSAIASLSDIRNGMFVPLEKSPIAKLLN